MAITVEAETQKSDHSVLGIFYRRRKKNTKSPLANANTIPLIIPVKEQ
jgi:hypothetical protein